MRKIILSVAVSLDGFIEGPKGEYDWCPPPSKNEMDEFVKGIDVVFMGRKSYEMAGGFMLSDKMTYIFSNSLKGVKGKNIRLLAGDVLPAVKKIQQEEGGNIWLWGGANLTTFFLNQNMVDEMWLAVVPILLGSGKPLFRDIGSRKLFKAVSASASSGYFSLVLKR
jgi:dihydrofolate reductase